MNKARLRQAADWVLNDGLRLGRARVGFNMVSWLNDTGILPDQGPRGGCQTTACIAGTVVIGADLYALHADEVAAIKTAWDHLNYRFSKAGVIRQEAYQWARRWLGLTERQADALFAPSLRYETITAELRKALPGLVPTSCGAWRLHRSAIPHTLAYHTMMHLHDTGEVDWSAGVERLLAEKRVELELAQ